MGEQNSSEKKLENPTTEKRYTARDFENMPIGPPYYELINNRLVEEPSPEIPHQRSSICLASKMFGFVEDNKLGLVLEAPMDVELDDDNVFQPDTDHLNFWVLGPQQCVFAVKTGGPR